MEQVPFVSVVVPCRNEARFIGFCLDSILAGDYPKERLEVLVVDGESDDGTRAIVETYARRHPFIRLLDNPRKITPAALNTGITHARGAILLWMSAHNRYETAYISRCVECLEAYDADNVGGIIRATPQRPGLIGEAIVTALGHRFGVGNSLFRIHTREPAWVDTVFGGCYRREVLDRVGPFNEHLVRGQDMEFNLRLRKAGGRTLLVPDIVSYYYARSDVRSFLKHNFANGVWAILPFLYSDIMPVSWRHLVPLVFLLAVFSAAILAALWAPGLWALAVIGGAYVAANVGASAHAAARERDVRYVAVLPFAFAGLHFAYGLGSCWGLVRALVHLAGQARRILS